MNWEFYRWTLLGTYLGALIPSVTTIFSYTNLQDGINMHNALVAISVGGLSGLGALIIKMFQERANESKTKNS